MERSQSFAYVSMRISPRERHFEHVLEANPASGRPTRFEMPDALRLPFMCPASPHSTTVRFCCAHIGGRKSCSSTLPHA